MIVIFFGFDCDLENFLRDLTGRSWINFYEKEGNMGERGLFRRKRKRKCRVAWVCGYPVSSKTLTVMEYLKRKGKKKNKRKKKRTKEK